MFLFLELIALWVLQFVISIIFNAQFSEKVNFRRLFGISLSPRNNQIKGIFQYSTINLYLNICTIRLEYPLYKISQYFLLVNNHSPWWLVATSFLKFLLAVNGHYQHSKNSTKKNFFEKKSYYYGPSWKVCLFTVDICSNNCSHCQIQLDCVLVQLGPLYVGPSSAITIKRFTPTVPPERRKRWLWGRTTTSVTFRSADHKTVIYS